MSKVRDFFNRHGFTTPSKVADTAPAKEEEIIEALHKMSIRDSVLEKFNTISARVEMIRREIKPYSPPKGVCPQEHVLAMDSAVALDASSFRTANEMFSGMGFPGFPYLTELTQITEYRDMSERVSAEMTRKWIELKSKSKQDKSEEIKRIEACMKKHQVRDVFRNAAVMEGFMGRAQVFMDLGDIEGNELPTPLMLNPFKIKLGSLRGFKLVEPITTYPADYNASNPLAQNYYRPNAWWVYGQKVHATRLLPFVSRPLPDLLKPSYNFSGMSMSQLAEPYVNYWLNTRDSVGKLLKNFSTNVVKMDLSSMLQEGDGGDVMKRLQVYTAMRDNQGIFALNKDTEDFMQVNTPLSGLDKLQAQAQEHMAAVAKTPLPILLGITPSGLNSTSDSEIQIFRDYVADQQALLFRANLETVLKVIQLSEFGFVDDDIVFDFVSLKDMDEAQLATIRKDDGVTGAQLIDRGVISAAEERQRLADDPNSGYDSLVASGAPIITGEEDSLLGAGEMDLEPGAIVPEVLGAKQADVQASAMNGAQITSLLEVIDKVVLGGMPKESARFVLQAAFPAVSPELINSMLAPIPDMPVATPQLAQAAPNAPATPITPSSPSPTI